MNRHGDVDACTRVSVKAVPVFLQLLGRALAGERQKPPNIAQLVKERSPIRLDTIKIENSLTVRMAADSEIRFRSEQGAPASPGCRSGGSSRLMSDSTW